MARAKTSSLAGEGMGWLQLMPFPALNPLNWWALASPRNALLASAHNATVALQMWRVSADACRALVREQQDAMLRLLGPASAEPENINERVRGGVSVPGVGRLERAPPGAHASLKRNSRNAHQEVRAPTRRQ